MACLRALIVLKSVVLGRLFHTLIIRHAKKWPNSSVGRARFI